MSDTAKTPATATATAQPKAAAAAPAAAAAAPAKAKAEPKPVAPKTVGGFALTAKISMGTKDDKKFGKDNNPKRAGSASHTKFAKYHDGMTVEEAVKAGITGADLSWDTKHGFIKIA